jgi:hypothetical protein
MAYSALSAFVVDQILGFQTMNVVRLNTLAALGMRAHADLGGDDVNGLLVSSYADVTSRRPVYLDGTNTGGLTRQARIQYRTSNAATSVIWRVRNITDSTTLAQGASSTSTSIVEEVVSITPAAGEKEYRLQVQGGNADNAIFAFGHLEQYA